MSKTPIKPISIKEHILHIILVLGTSFVWLPFYLVRVLLKQREIKGMTADEKAEWKRGIKQKYSKDAGVSNTVSVKAETYTKRKFASQDESDDDEWSQFADDYSFEAVGESHYRDTILAIIDKNNAHKQGELFLDAVMQTEPNNKFDEFAVAIYIDGKKVGHVPSDYSYDVTTYLDEQNVTAIKVKAVLGWNTSSPNPPIGVRLDFNF
jgi:hypothetical protein